MKMKQIFRCFVGVIILGSSLAAIAGEEPERTELTENKSVVEGHNGTVKWQESLKEGDAYDIILNVKNADPKDFRVPSAVANGDGGAKWTTTSQSARHADFKGVTDSATPNLDKEGANKPYKPKFHGEFVPKGEGGEGEGGGVPVWDLDGEYEVKENKWVKYEPISGVGDIIKTSPIGPNSNNLHYAGGRGNAEIATFKIDVSKAVDMDKNIGTDEIADAGLDEGRTAWTIPQGTGHISDDGFTATFTPGTTVASNITIEAEIFEGKKYSYTDKSYDDSVKKKWHQTLNTFKVGVALSPGNKKIYEDSGLKVLNVNLGTEDMDLLIDWSGWTDTPGKVEKGEAYTKSVSWKALAETSSGSVAGIMGSINYTPSINVQGKGRMYGGCSGPTTGAGLGTITSTLAGVVSPYAGAAVTIALAIAPGVLTATQYHCAVAGESVLENVSKKSIKVSVSGTSQKDPKIYDLSSLSIAGSNVAADVGDISRGSVDVKSLIAIFDNSWVSDAFAVITTSAVQGAKIISSSMSSSRPFYK